MLKQTAQDFNAGRYADAALAASRQVWLAGLGAAIVTRDWARNDAGHVFRALVQEGASVESQVKRVIGKQLDQSIATATRAVTKARTTALTAVNAFGGLVDAAVGALPQFRAQAPKARTASKAKPVKARVVRKTRRGKRATRRAS
jgi:poly(hydroxyalkanoate) granule associated protein phasin